MKLADTVIEKDWDRDKGFVCGCLHQLNKPFFSCFLQRSKKHRFRAWMISGIKEKLLLSNFVSKYSRTISIQLLNSFVLRTAFKLESEINRIALVSPYFIVRVIGSENLRYFLDQ